jgi:mRNA-degrading endonuclease toxin of MazEF toxin-antitoxin module
VGTSWIIYRRKERAFARTGLPADSVANISQIVTGDKRFLLEYCGRLRPRTMDAIAQGMRPVLDL